MNEQIINIRSDENYITLNVVLKLSGLISTGGQAKFFLVENDIKVNDVSEQRRGRKLYKGDVVTVKDQKILIQ